MAANDEFQMIIFQMGTTGGGKTGTGLILGNLLLHSDPSRYMVFWNTPATIVDSIEKVCPPYMRGRIEVATKLREVRPNAFLVVDEGVAQADAKEALKVEMRSFVKALSYSRHLRIITLLNATDDGVLLGFRKKSQLQFYKLLTAPLIDLSKNAPFLKKHKGTLIRLRPWETLFVSSYKYFQRTGIMKMALGRPNPRLRVMFERKGIPNLCSWYTTEISKNMSEVSFDYEWQKTQERRVEIEKLVNEAIKKFGDRLLKTRSNQLIEGWLLTEKREIYHDFKRHITEISRIAFYKLEMRKIQKEQKKKKKKDGPVRKDLLYDKKMSFPDFLRNNIIDPTASEICALIAEGLSQKDVAGILKKSMTTVSAVFKEWRDGIGDKDKGRLGYLFEDWFAKNRGGGKTAGPSRTEPDFVDSEGNIWSLKLRFLRDATLTFYQEKNFGPEYRLAKGTGSTYFVGLLNPSWDQTIRVLEVDPHQDEKVNICKHP
jgi:hypothetical protein